MFRRTIRQRRSKIKNYKVAIIGSGAREHAIADKFSEDNRITNIYVLPGNDGMIGGKIEINSKITQKKDILSFCLKNKIDLVFVGGEVPLVYGLVDILIKNNINTFGPTQENARLEGSKCYSKKIMREYGIPTAKYKEYDNYQEIFTDIRLSDMDIVIKYDGLASGKGVFLPNDQEEAQLIVYNIFQRKVFDKTPKAIIEDKLIGVECSLMGFCNGEEIFFMPQAQDYKKRNNNDEGPNTGGMGSIAPVNILTELEITYMKALLDKLVRELKYVGILYAGLMKTNNGIYVLEFNCRYGDPEAQVLLNLLKTNLYDICIDCIKGNTPNIQWYNKSCMNLVLSHNDYPFDKSNTFLEIENIDKVPEDFRIYYANVKKMNKVLYTNGGRVLSMVYCDDSLEKCYNKLYNNINITYKNIYYRSDIAYKYIQEKLNTNNKLTYKSSGVDIDKGNEFIKIIKDICKDNDNTIGGFSGIIEYNNVKLAASTDGVGTKLEIVKKLKKYDTIGIDLVAMCVNDLIVQGAKPLIFLDYFATGKLDLDIGRDLIYGINEGCKKAGCKLIGGETAEMPIVYSQDNFDLAGFSLGVIEGEIYPKKIIAGDIIFGLASSGVHSNGFSLINKLLEITEYNLEDLLTPTKIYVDDVEQIKSTFGKYVKGFSHITGGGLIENINRLLDDEHNIKINYEWDIPDVFRWIYCYSEMDTQDMLKTYNCGIGMAVILDKNMFKDKKKNEVQELINKHNLIPIGMIIKHNQPEIDYDLIQNKLL